MWTGEGGLGVELFAALPSRNWWAFIPSVLVLILPKAFAESEPPSADYRVNVESHYRVGYKKRGITERDALLGPP